MQIKVTTVLNVSFCEKDDVRLKSGDPLRKQVEEAVAEAVTDALWRRRQDGFSHPMEALLSILPDNEVRAEYVDD